MKKPKLFIATIRPDETDSVREYYPRFGLDSLVEDVKIFHNQSDKIRKSGTWTGLAFKFKKEMTQDQMISFVVFLKADEYWGTENGYHLFWFD